MHDRDARRALADIAAIRSAQRIAAHHELLIARDREQEAGQATARADAQTAAAAQDWETHLSGSFFAPEFAQALAGALIECGQAGSVARAHEQQMAAAHSVAEGEWHAGDARCRVADRAAEASRRAHRGERDERALEALAERVTQCWRRR